MTPRPLKTAVEILLSGEIQKSDSRRQKMAVFRRALSMIVLSPQANRPGASIMAMSKCEREILSGLTSDDLNKGLSIYETR